MKRQRTKYRHLLYFMPGLVVLLLGMFLIHASVSLTQERTSLQMLYKLYAAQHVSSSKEGAGRLAREDQKIQSLIDKIKDKEANLYWAIIAISLFGFVLVVLNADKLSKLATANDEKKRTLELLENRMSAMEITLDGIVIIDKDENISYINHALMDIYGIGEEQKKDYLNNHWIQLLPEIERQKIEEGTEPSPKECGVWSNLLTIETMSKTLAKKKRKIEFTLAQLENGSMIATVRDVTDKIDGDEEKKEIQAQLYQAQKMEAIGRLAGGIAHDFNNILAAMNGYAEFLVEDLEEETSQHQFAENIIKAGAQARALVDQMLAFSRHKGSEFEAMDLMNPMNEALSMLKASLPKSIEVKTDFPLDFASIEGNLTQIMQLIMNLCVNAKDAMEDQGGILKMGISQSNIGYEQGQEWQLDELPKLDDNPLIRLSDLSPGTTELLLGGIARNHPYICLSIEDTGSGMSRAIMEHVFEPFFTTKPVDKGTGLGLSTTHGVITAHRGALRIESTLGEGTRFDLFFPLMEGQAPEATAEDEEILTIESSVGNILLVEDDEHVRDMSFKMLERLAYEVEVAETGMVALEILREIPDHFDLVITDQNMPKMTGIELIYQAHMDCPDIPFILLSGYSEQKLQDLMKEHPAVKAIVRKPVTKQELGEKIAETLSLHSRRKDGNTQTQAA